MMPFLEILRSHHQATAQIKRKWADTRSALLCRTPKAWVRRLFRRKPEPFVSWKRKREARALAKASHRAYFGLALGAAVGVALFAILLSVPPHMSPEDLAASVKAQSIRKRPADPLTESTFRSPALSSRPQPRAEETFVTGMLTGAVLVSPRSGQYLAITFEQLSGFPFCVTDQMLDAKHDSVDASMRTMNQIPDDVKALSGKEASLSGFMLPLKYEGKLTTEFLLLRNQSLCCFGIPPKITEWVNVRMRGKGVKVIMDEPVTVCGVFHVGDVRQNGHLVGIYRVDADKLKGPRE